MFYSLRICVCLFLISPPAAAIAADKTQKISSDALRNDQLAVSGRYDRFERLLSQMADILGQEDPERAELLRQAISKGREKAISSQLGQIAEDLGHNNLGKALEQQEEALESLAILLQLLQSEDRRSELEKERERLNNLLKDVSNTLSQQKSARASTQNSNTPSSSAPNQQKAINRAEKVLNDIKIHDPQSEDAVDDESTDGDNDKSGSPSDNQSGRHSENPAESSPADHNQLKSDSENKQPDAETSEDESKDSQSQTSKQGNKSERRKIPGKDEVFRARQLMQAALEQLQKQLRDKALEKQDGAIEELQKAVEELRNKLLQLREEEKEMILASLEARFQRMLTRQAQLYDETVDLNTTPVDNWLDTMFARSREVAQQQAELQVASEQTLGLLKEDGTSVAIVLSVEDISIDMRTVANRLQESKVSRLTQTLETDIIEALKELIEATQHEIQDMKSEEQQQQAQAGEQNKPPLVQLVAEIKILRSLQLRINRRTQRTDQLMAETGESGRADLIRQLEELTARQQRLVKSTEELGKRMHR